MEEGRPGDGADFGVGVAVDEEGGAGGVGGVRIGDPPGGDGEGAPGLLVADGEGEGLVGHVEVGGGEAFEKVDGFAVGHARGAEEFARHGEGNEKIEEDGDGQEDDREGDERGHGFDIIRAGGEIWDYLKLSGVGVR